MFYIDLDTLILDASVDLTVDINSMRTPLAISMDSISIELEEVSGDVNIRKRYYTYAHTYTYSCMHSYIHIYIYS